MITKRIYKEQYNGGLSMRHITVYLLFGFIPLYKIVIEGKS